MLHKLASLCTTFYWLNVGISGIWGFCQLIQSLKYTGFFVFLNQISYRKLIWLTRLCIILIKNNLYFHCKRIIVSKQYSSKVWNTLSSLLQLQMQVESSIYLRGMPILSKLLTYMTSQNCQNSMKINYLFTLRNM